MTYQEIVDNFRQICSYHEIIREFGYGAISDIKTNNTDFSPDPLLATQSQEATTLYPYVYLVPQQSTRTSQAITYRFNMIVMDTVLPNGLELIENSTYEDDQKDPPYGTTLKVQSDCQQYIDDILAQLKLGSGESREMDIQLNVNLTPFKERFQDTVAGMTATIELEIAQPLNLCIAPFKSVLVEYALNPGLSTEPDPTGQVIGAVAPTEIGTEYWYTPDPPAYPYKGVYIPKTGTYEVDITGVVRQEEAKPLADPISITVYKVDSTGVISAEVSNLEPNIITGWPEGQSVIGDFPFTARWTFSTSTLQPGESFSFNYAYRGATPDDESSISFPSSKIIIRKN